MTVCPRCRRTDEHELDGVLLAYCAHCRPLRMLARAGTGSYGSDSS